MGMLHISLPIRDDILVDSENDGVLLLLDDPGYELV